MKIYLNFILILSIFLCSVFCQSSCTIPSDCYDDSCNLFFCIRGGCFTKPSVQCTSSDPCIIAKGCLSYGVCTKESKDCNDNDLCTSDSCQPFSGCIHTPIAGCCSVDADCDDGDLCTVDRCSEGICQNDPIPNCCLIDSDCTAPHKCVGIFCSINEFSGLGTCTLISLPVEDTPCNDNNLCTIDTCSPNTADCLHNFIICNDGDETTIDTCDPEIGCVFTPIAVCGNGIIEGGEECDDENQIFGKDLSNLSCCKDCKLLSFGNIKSRFLGESTQIELFQTSCTTDEISRYIQFKLNSIKEIFGKDLSNLLNSKNKITQLASQHLDFIGPEEREMFNTIVSYTEMSGSMRKGNKVMGDIKVAMIFFHNDTDIQIGGKSFHVEKNTLKFNIELLNWPFESINNNDGDEDKDTKNKLRFSIRLKTSNISNTFSEEVGNGIKFTFPLAEGSDEENGFVFFPFTVIVDGEDSILTIEHTKEGTHIDIDLIFPNFETSLVYDPLGWFEIPEKFQETDKLENKEVDEYNLNTLIASIIILISILLILITGIIVGSIDMYRKEIKNNKIL